MSDKIKPATDELVDRIIRDLSWGELSESQQVKLSLCLRIEAQQAEIERLRRLCVQADSFLSLIYYRYKGTVISSDIMEEIGKLFPLLRSASKGESSE